MVKKNKCGSKCNVASKRNTKSSSNLSKSKKVSLKVVENDSDESFYCGTLAKGCKHCIKGSKLVIFITGLCPQRCYYCPVSEEKFAKDRIFANEREIEEVSELIEEAKLMNASGAGITGGDPLTVVSRCVDYIKKLKEEFGKDFHIHLYTPMKLVSSKVLKELYEGGLDEIRFHPDLDDKSLWERLKLAVEFDWDIGIEIPCIPNKDVQTKELVDYVSRIKGISFINLNELEFSDTTVSHYKLSDEGLEPKNQSSYGVKGSSELAREIISYVKLKGYDLTVYFCPSRLKDRTQLGNRLKRMASNVKLIGDIVSDEGTLIRGVVYLDELKPGFDYRKKIAEVALDVKKSALLLDKLNKLKEEVAIVFKKRSVFVDERKFRLIISKAFVIRNMQKLKRMGLVAAVIEEYPTHDAFELEVDFI